MEAPDYLHAGYYIGVSGGMGPQPPPEKHGDHFVVEDLFDFSNEDDDEEEAFVSGAVADEVGYDAAGGSSGDSSSASVVAAVESCNSSLSGFGARVPGEFDLSGELGEPHDELAELEWLSNIVEESFSSEDLEKLQLISGVKSSPASSAAAAPPRFFPETPVPGKARSKRSRIAPCDWSSRLLALSPVPPSDAPAKKAPKPAKKRDPSEGPRYAVADGRRCLHCETDKTPQWRTGPMGPKTLCNACGVRYKSGRLVPEYRPAASPTFMMSMHSNSHRKVLELRRQKEVMQQQLLVSSDCGAGAGDDFLIHHRAGPDFRQLM